MSAEILKTTWLLKSFWILLCLIGWKAQARLKKLGNRSCTLDLFSIYIFSLFCSIHLTLCCFLFSRGTTYCIWWWSSFSNSVLILCHFHLMFCSHLKLAKEGLVIHLVSYVRNPQYNALLGDWSSCSKYCFLIMYLSESLKNLDTRHWIFLNGRSWQVVGYKITIIKLVGVVTST